MTDKEALAKLSLNLIGMRMTYSSETTTSLSVCRHMKIASELKSEWDSNSSVSNMTTTVVNLE
jgi:hypothetical protein